MIVTCASCLTKFSLDDSKVSAKGAKVRCSRCQHIFFIMPPLGKKEEIVKDFESFAKYHETSIGSGPKEVDISPPLEKEEKRVIAEEREEISPLYKKTTKERVEPKTKVERKKKMPSRIFFLLIVLVLLAFGAFYLWTESGDIDKLTPYIEYPIKKVTDLWDQIFQTGK